MIKAALLEQLAARIGRENLLTSEADRLVYSTDIGAPPNIVDLLVKRRADAVARIQSAEDLELVVSFCRANLIPMTPRAAATSALGGAVPKRRGIVLDLSPLNKHIAIDEKALTVTADAGVVLWDLQKRLNDVGLELPCYPTSALAATIGGFVAMDGHGIHSTRNGNIGKWVLEAEGVNPDGTRFAIRDRDTLDGIVGLGGSTAILTRIKLQVVEASPDKPVLITLKGDAAAQQLVQETTAKWRLKHAMLHNSDYFALRSEATGVKKSPVAAGKWGVLLVFREADHNGAKEELARIVARLGGEIADDKLASDEWAARFYPIRAKLLGPSLVAGEVFVPLDATAAYLADLRSKARVKDLSCEGHVTDDGRVYWFIFTLDDERRPTYPLGWGTAARIVSLAKRHGGRAYHCGTWLQWEAKNVFGPTRYRKLKAIKAQADNRNLLNPGMVFPLPAPIPEFVYKMKISGPTPAPSLGFQLAAGNPILQLIGGAVPYKRHKTLGVKAADTAADAPRGGPLSEFSDALWGADLASLQAIANPGDLPMTQTVRGKMVLALAYAQSKVANPWSLKPALDVADPSAAEGKVAPDYATAQKVLDAFRRQVAAEGVTLTVKAVEVKVEAKAHAVVAVAQKKGNVEEIKKQAAATPEPKKAWVLMADCIVCNGCQSACPTDAAIVTDTARVDRDLCIADGACFDACPTGAIRPGIEVEATSAGWPKGSRLYGKFGKAEA
ncbi:MAG: FAD-binding protein [Candidatus Thermoplasmatota archaeon]